MTQIQRAPYTRQQYIDAGCEQFGGRFSSQITTALFVMTNGLMCNGCPVMHDRNGCRAFKTLSQPGYVHLPPKPPTETVRQEASRRGISIGEVRRQRQASLASG